MDAAQLPAISNARLPAVYEEARRALVECSQVDECQQWADKAEAMASYARQARDETLRKMADRIQARAIRRCGELLRQIPQSLGGRPTTETREGAHPSFSRSQAATDAGLSEHQRKTALRVAAVPEPDFETQVESDAPPTVTQLAQQGTKRQGRPAVELNGIPPQDYVKATAAIGTLRRFAEFCAMNEPVVIAHAVQAHEVSMLRAQVSTVDSWLDQFITNLPERLACTSTHN